MNLCDSSEMEQHETSDLGGDLRGTKWPSFDVKRSIVPRDGIIPLDEVERERPASSAVGT